MICSLILGRKGSVGFPGKNTYEVSGHPLASYPMRAALQSKEIERHFISTDDSVLMKIANKIGFEIIERPDELATAEALGDDAYKHGYKEIQSRIDEEVELLVLLFCNAPTINPSLIEKGINLMRKNPEADSAITVSRYNMYSPTRARRISDNGYLQPYIPFEHHPDMSVINCDRDSQGDVWFADVALSVIRPDNLENIENGLLPQKWMGRKILPIYNEAGLDIDYEWQLGQIEWWLNNKLRD